uniref:Pro-Pol polyprotein n=1 Tax=Bovine foamy virus TaxID=207343 RepID=A0A8D5R2J1_9RETR|nr:pol protein [Bovine foamy virus]
MPALRPLQVEIKGNHLKGYWDSGAEITCVPAIYIIEEQPVGKKLITTIHDEKEHDVYYVEMKIEKRKVQCEVIATALDYVLIAPVDIPWYKPGPLELTIKIDVESQKHTLIAESTLSPQGKVRLKKLLDQYQALWQCWENQVGHRRIEPHKIATGALKPRPQKQYHINPRAKADIQIVIDDLLRQGVLRQQNSEMNTPVYPVPKADGRWRMVLDYREVNKVTPLVATQNCHSASILNTLYRGPYKSTLDLANGFWAHPIKPEDYWITAFTWGGKTYCWTVLPQGFLNSPALFTADVVDILKDIPNVQVYVDDVYVSSATEQEHLDILETIFNRLSTAGYIVSLKKSKLAKETVEFLGFSISQNGRGLTDSYKQKLMDLQPPTTLRQLQSILGLINFARNFLPNFAELVAPLYQLIPKAKGQCIPWTMDHTTQLKTIIQALNSTENLEERRPDVDLIMKVHISNTAGYIRFYNHGGQKPVAYNNALFTSTELKFTPTEKIMATIHKGLLKALDLSLGKEIHVYSAIASMTKLQKTPLSERKALSIRWLKWQTYFEDPRIKFHHDATLPDLQNLPVPQQDTGKEMTILPLLHYEAIFYTDGSAIRSPKPNKTHSAGMGIIQAKFEPDFKIIHLWSFPLGDHTAQYAEIAAFEFAIRRATGIRGPVLIVTDSNYVAKSYNEELPYWESNGFVNNKKKTLKHISKWKAIAECKNLKADIHVIHEPGHQPAEASPHAQGNALADKQAVSGSYKVFSNELKPSLDAELEQVLSTGRPNPQGYPNKYEYKLVNGLCYVDRRGEEGLKIIPPKADRVKLCQLAHDGLGSAHLGRSALLLKLQQKYWWPRMHIDASRIVLNCTVCAQTNPTNQKPRPPLVIPHDTKPFQVWYMDYIGPLPPSNGYQHALVIVDAGTGFTWIYPTKAQTANATVKALTHLTGTAVPKVLHSDQGPAFTSSILADWAKDRGIQLEHSAPYHPQSSGKVERKNSEIKRLLTKLLAGRPTKWYPLIPIVQLALNNTPNTRQKYTPHQLMYGVDCNLPFENLDTLDLTREEQLAVLKEVRDGLLDLYPSPSQTTARSWTPSPGLLVQERVARPAQLRPKWRKPTPIKKVLNERTVIIDHLGQDKVVSIDNLKPAAHQKLAQTPDSAEICPSATPCPPNTSLWYDLDTGIWTCQRCGYQCPDKYHQPQCTWSCEDRCGHRWKECGNCIPQDGSSDDASAVATVEI